MHDGYSRAKKLLTNELAHGNVEVAPLNARCLLEVPGGFEVRLVRDEGRALVLVLERYVARNGAALEEDVTVIVDVGPWPNGCFSRKLGDLCSRLAESMITNS